MTPNAIRRKIQTVDKAILKAVQQRMQWVNQLSELESTVHSTDDVIAKSSTASKSIAKADAQRILRQIDSYCFQQTASQQICYLGPIYSYSFLASLLQFGAFQDYKPVQSISAVFEEVSSGKSKFGVVPIENSTDGRIADTLTMFSQHTATIYREIHLPIHHCLIGLGKLDEIKEIRSKTQALSQCRDWLDKNISNKVKRTPTNSSSEAAQDALAMGKHVAAIASREAAEGLGLKVIAPNIEDQEGNLTRFAVIISPDNQQIEPPKKSGHDKTSIMFEIPHQPGALADVINIFKKSKLNLTWIESFPKPGAFSEYTFFAEFQGHCTVVKVRNALAALEKKTTSLTRLGSYPEFQDI